MKTKADLINDATLVVDCLQREEARPSLQGPDNAARYAARGLAAAIINDLYYQAPERVRASFGYDVAELFKLAGWE